MGVYHLVFYLLAAFILVTATLAVTSRQIFRSAIYLLFSMVGIAGLYFWMQYEFIAAVQIVVYVGGVVVLIIFSIFLTHRVGSNLAAPAYRQTIAAGLASIFAFTLLWVIIKQAGLVAGTSATGLSVQQIGREMLNYSQGGFVLPFEVVSMLLLAAMIGCIVIALKAPNKEISNG